MSTHRTSRTASLPLLAMSALVLALATAACARPAAKGTPTEASGSKVTTSSAGSSVTSEAGTTGRPPVAESESLAARTMPYEKRKATMPTGLPIEIPVIGGSVVSTSAAVSSTSWLYTIETSGTVATVGDWYVRAYSNAAWRVMSDSSADGGRGLTFAKHAAQSVLRIRELRPGMVEVRASIGVGQRAPQTN